jgi:hypothetical protein
MPCSSCKNILVGYTLAHNEEACPFKAALICTFCNKTGHSNVSCKEKVVYPSIRLTQERVPRIERTKIEIDIRWEDRNICAYLRSQGIQPSQKPKKNLDLLNEYCARNNLIVKKKMP